MTVTEKRDLRNRNRGKRNSRKKIPLLVAGLLGWLLLLLLLLLTANKILKKTENFRDAAAAADAE